MATKKSDSGKKVKSKPVSGAKAVSKDKKQGTPVTVKIRNEVLSLMLFMLAVFIYIVVTRFQGLPDDIVFIGVVGTYSWQGLEFLFGEAAYCAAFFLLAWSAYMGISKELWSGRMWGIFLLFLIVLTGYGIYHIPGGITPLAAGLKGMGGGVIGGGLAYLLQQLVGEVGTMIVLICGCCIALVLIVNRPLGQIYHLIADFTKRVIAKISTLVFYEAPETPVAPVSPRSKEQELADVQTEPSPLSYEIAAILSLPEHNHTVEPEPEELFLPSAPPARKAGKPGQEEGFIYRRPPLDLLGSISSDRGVDKKSIKDSIAILEDTFASFGIQAKVNQVSCGPTVTRFELTPPAGVKVSRIVSLTDDLQLNLATAGIRIEAPIPGKSAIGIEVPNRKVFSVGLSSLLAAAVFKKSGHPLTFALGEDISGVPIIARLSDMPHLLVAGSTGSGKSVCINSIIMSMLYNSTPDELKFVFIDPKMVELTVYNGIPHLLTPVVTDAKKASVVLKWMATEMEKRYKLFADKGVRDITRYNQTADQALPYIVIIIDELADLMMVAPVEVEDAVCRLAQMARAAGMHLIVATQRPSVDVVTGIIKANIPSRIAFAVSSSTDSRTILDSSGAEKLLGKGDMLFLPMGAAKPLRVQGAFVTDADIEKTVGFICSQQPEQVEEPTDKELEAFLEQAGQDYGDDLFWEAVKIFVDSQKVSASYLQRRLKIGYSRAARLVDLMEERGIVSEMDASKKRELLIDNVQLERIFANNKQLS